MYMYHWNTLYHYLIITIIDVKHLQILDVYKRQDVWSPENPSGKFPIQRTGGITTNDYSNYMGFTKGNMVAILYFVSSVAAIGGLGHLIGRGALISVLMVLFLLPVLLTMADPLLMKEEAKKVRLEEARLAARQKKRDLKEQMKQKMEQMKTEPQKEPPSKNLENEVKEHEK